MGKVLISIFTTRAIEFRRVGIAHKPIIGSIKLVFASEEVEVNLSSIELFTKGLLLIEILRIPAPPRFGSWALPTQPFQRERLYCFLDRHIVRF
jgi:hypothetical protein